MLGLLHSEDIKNIFASDANEKILKFAEKNLSLLNVDGLSRRISELENFIIDYDKDSHRDALRSAKNIEQIVKGLKIETKIFELNVLENIQLNDFVKNIDIVITDIPYGNLVKWYGLNEGINPVQIMLDKIKKRLNPISIVAVVSDKKQEIKHEGFEQVKKFKVGKRKVFLLSPITT